MALCPILYDLWHIPLLLQPFPGHWPLNSHCNILLAYGQCFREGRSTAATLFSLPRKSPPFKRKKSGVRGLAWHHLWQNPCCHASHFLVPADSQQEKHKEEHLQYRVLRLGIRFSYSSLTHPAASLLPTLYNSNYSLHTLSSHGLPALQAQECKIISITSSFLSPFQVFSVLQSDDTISDFFVHKVFDVNAAGRNIHSILGYYLTRIPYII